MKPTKGDDCMEDKPIIEFKGRNGRIGLYRDFVRLDRGTVLGVLFQGLKGKKDLYFNNITSIQIKKPGLSVGYLQFSIPGGNESKGGVSPSIDDENTISFDGKKKFEKALAIKDYIEKKIISKNSNSVSMADEIEKLHSLMEKGILTKKEFNEKKKRILES